MRNLHAQRVISRPMLAVLAIILGAIMFGALYVGLSSLSHPTQF